MSGYRSDRLLSPVLPSLSEPLCSPSLHICGGRGLPVLSMGTLDALSYRRDSAVC